MAELRTGGVAPHHLVLEHAHCCEQLPQRRPSDAVWLTADGRVGAFGRLDTPTAGCIVLTFAQYRFDLESGRVKCARTAGTSAAVAEDAFHRTVVPLLLAASGRTVLHASSVVSQNAAVAFMAVSMTGKSTTAVYLAQRGFTQTGDDVALLRIDGDECLLDPVPFRPKLRAESADLLGEPDGSRLIEHEGPVRLAAIFDLVRTDDPVPSVERLSSAEALRALLGNSVVFDTADEAERRRVVASYVDVIRNTTVATLRLPAGIDRLEPLPGMIAELL